MVDFRQAAREAARRHGVPEDLFLRVIQQESGFRPDVTSSAGAYGLAQLMPGTAADLGVDPRDPLQNLEGGARYLRQQLDAFGDPALALAAYNAGPGRVRQYNGIPPFEETQNYVRSILGGGSMPMNLTPTASRMQQPEQPRGLLEFMGIQRRDPSAEGETALPFYQRPRFADFMGGLAVGLNELRQQPSQAIPQIVARGQEQRQKAQQRNATADWIESQGRADLAEGIRNGSLTATQAMQMMQRPSPIEVDGRLVDPQTFEVLYEGPAEGPDNEAIRAARGEFTGLPAVRDFADQTAAYGRVVTSAADPSPAGDLALIFNYMKMLDPGSVVREGEFATAQNAGGVDDRTRSFYNRVLEGTRLSPGQREDFLDRSTRLYSQAEEQYSSLADQYAAFARAAGLPVEQVIPDFRFTGERPRSEVPPTPEGYTREQWIELWRNMTPEQRQAFVEASQ